MDTATTNEDTAAGWRERATARPIVSWAERHEKLLDHVRYYSHHGVPVFPCYGACPADEYSLVCGCGNPGCSNAAKHPAIKDYAARATSDLGNLFYYWERFREGPNNWNIGMITGPRSGFWVLDVDVGSGKDGAAEIEALEAQHGKLPPTVTVLSGSRRRGASHRFFEWDARLSSDLGCRPGVDVLAGGKKLVVAPGSVHISGNTYAFVRGLALHDMKPARAPEWLIQVILEASATQIEDARRRRMARDQRDWIEPGPAERAFRAAALAYNRDHTETWPTGIGVCPACTSPTGFRLSRAATPENPAWWVCFSERHKLLPTPCGLQNSDGSYSGTQLDLHAYGRGLSVRALLVQRGYLRS